MQFPEDWPGIFIRGDEAFWLAMQLNIVLHPEEADEFALVIARDSVAGLATLLASCDVRKKPTPTVAQLVQPEAN